MFVPLLDHEPGRAAESGTWCSGRASPGSARTPALIAFAIATVLEIAGYYIPWVDNLLDAVATPTAIVAGVLVTASAITADGARSSSWTLAILAGGGTAAIFQGITATARQISSFTTGGLGNPLVATAEAGGSALLSVLAITLPVAGGAPVVAAPVLRREAAAVPPAAGA